MLSKTIVLTAVATCCLAHSWVERLMRISSNSTIIGEPGFIRGAVARSDPAFTDFQMQALLLSNEVPICKTAQATGNYTTELPPLQAYPGDFIALQYQENGHVTLLQNTPQKGSSGNVYIYGTSSPIQGDLLASVHKVWNRQGTGGNARGRLLATWSFDDGRCYQINNGPISTARQSQFSKAAIDPQGADLWCQIDIRLPADICEWYSLYWVWDWPIRPTDMIPEGQLEIYTSCMDIKILPGLQQAEPYFIKGQDLNLAGIEEQMQGMA